MNEPTDWTSAIAILAGGLVLGALIVYYFTRRKSSPVLGGDLERKDLEAKRDALVAQLRALDEDNIEERTRLEGETAKVLRELDRRPQVAASATAPVVGTGMNPAAKGFLWGAGSFAALAGLFYFVMQSSTPRQEGGSLTGNTPVVAQPQRQQAAPQTSAMVQQLEAAVRTEPNNLKLRNDLAQAYLETDNLMAVFEQTKFVLEKSPNDARALTMQSLVRMAMGEADEALTLLHRATQNDPSSLDAWVALAWVNVQQNKIADAEQAIASAKKASPNDVARIDQVFAQMKSQASGAPAAAPDAMASGDLPAGHPPVNSAAAPAPAAASAPADGRFINVTLDIDPAAAHKAGILFVIARNPMGGPPVAVKRLQVASFPVTLQLSSADSMMGQPLPDSFRLEARLDSDGDATTKPPTDPSAMQNDVAPGTTVKLALK